VYQGHLVDLTVYWEHFPAAKLALSNNIIPEHVKTLTQRHYYILQQCILKLDKYIIEGQLIEEYALDHTKELMNCLRDSNVTLRWLMLHRKCKNKKFIETIDDGANKDERMKETVKIILYLSKYENQLKAIFSNLVSQKTQIWADDK
jgi:hypothetical protein